MAYTNPGPSRTTTVNTQSPYSPEITIQTIAVNLTPAAIGAAGTSEQTFAGLNTGLKAGDVIIGVSPPAVAAAAAVISGRVSPTADDTFMLQFVATAAGTPSPGLYLLTIGRFNQSTRPPGSTTYAFVPTAVV